MIRMTEQEGYASAIKLIHILAKFACVYDFVFF